MTRRPVVAQPPPSTPGVEAAELPDTPAGVGAVLPNQAPHGSRVIEQLDISDRLELLVIDDIIYNTPTTVFEVHCWSCRGTDEYDTRDDAITYGHERHRCRHASESDD